MGLGAILLGMGVGANLLETRSSTFWVGSSLLVPAMVGCVRDTRTNNNSILLVVFSVFEGAENV